MSAAEYYKANVGLVHAIAQKGYKRLHAAGVGIDYDDVFQELSVVFIKAYEGFDASFGFKFTTYYYRAAYNKLNSWAQDLIDERVKHGVISVDELDARDGDDFSAAETLMIDPDTPEGHYRVTQFLTHITDTLSPLAGLILSWVVCPPPEIMAEIKKAEANAVYGRSLGYNSRCMVNISPRYVARFIRMISNVSQVEADGALREIERLRYSDAKQYLGA